MRGKVVPAGLIENCGQMPGCFRRCGTGPAQHMGDDVLIEHALNRDPFRGGIETDYFRHSGLKRLPMVRSGAPDQGSVNVEKADGGTRASPMESQCQIPAT